MNFIEAITALTAIISIIISVLTLRQNAKTIEETNRPYVCVYGAMINLNKPEIHIVIKNFGATAAYITGFSVSENFSQYAYIPTVVPFAKIKGSFIAPGQRFESIINAGDHKDLGPIVFSIIYESTSKQYLDTFTVDPQAILINTNTRIYEKSDGLRSISYTLQDINEKLL